MDERVSMLIKECIWGNRYFILDPEWVYLNMIAIEDMKDPQPTKTAVSQEANVAKVPFRHMIGQALTTKESIKAYFKGEITIQELHARGIKFVNTI